MTAIPTRRPARSARVPLVLLAGALLATACGGSDGGSDGGGTPVEPPRPPATLALSAAPAAVTVQQGQSGTATVTLTRGGHAAVVTLGAAVAGSPAGVTATFASASVPAGETETAVTFATTPATPPGDHAVTVTGIGGGANAATTVVLRVTPAPVPSYALTVAPSPVAVTAGGSATAATVSVARTTFAGAVTLAVSGAPAGLTVTPPAQPVTEATAGLVVQAAASLAAGDYPVTVTGTAAGLAPVTAGVVVRVAAAAGGQPAQPAPGTITGVALDTRGRPIANALVWIRPALHTGLVTARTGADGRYTARGLLTIPAIPYYTLAWTEFEYRNRTYCARLASANPGDYAPFVPTEGAVRDFRWQLSGRIPSESTMDPSYFGQEVRLFYRLDEWLQDDDAFELKLTPQGPLADGSEGQVHTRTIRIDEGSIFQDIPLGVYTVEATWVRDGVRTPLRVNRNGSDEYARTATLDWTPVGCTGSSAPSMRSFLYLSR